MAQDNGKSSFFQPSTDRRIKEAESSLNASLEEERPDELGRKIKEQEGKDKQDDQDKDNLPDADGHNWKERYGNLQRFVQKRQNDFKTTIAGLEAKVTDLTNKIEELTSKAAKTSDIPESAEDVEELKKENPAAYNAIVRIAKTLAEEIVNEKTKALVTEVAAVRQGQKKNEADSAYIKLQKLHPDLDLEALESTPEFVDWIENKPQSVQDLLYKNKSDVEGASTVLTLFKLETGFGKKKPGRPKKDNAEDVHTRAPVDIPDGKKDWLFVESEIETRSNRERGWLEANLEAIDKASREGKILLDISDPKGTAKRLAATGM